LRRLNHGPIHNRHVNPFGTSPLLPGPFTIEAIVSWPVVLTWSNSVLQVHYPEMDSIVRSRRAVLEIHFHAEDLAAGRVELPLSE
jgi:hypothetical protein